jgi:hypothetical protein
MRVDPFFRLDDTDHARVGIENVVGEPGSEGELANCDASGCPDIHCSVVLHVPPCLGKSLVDQLTGLLLRGHREPGGRSDCCSIRMF